MRLYLRSGRGSWRPPRKLENYCQNIVRKSTVSVILWIGVVTETTADKAALLIHLSISSTPSSRDAETRAQMPWGPRVSGQKFRAKSFRVLSPRRRRPCTHYTFPCDLTRLGIIKPMFSVLRLDDFRRYTYDTPSTICHIANALETVSCEWLGCVRSVILVVGWRWGEGWRSRKSMNNIVRFWKWNANNTLYYIFVYDRKYLVAIKLQKNKNKKINLPCKCSAAACSFRLWIFLHYYNNA